MVRTGPNPIKTSSIVSSNSMCVGAMCIRISWSIEKRVGKGQVGSEMNLTGEGGLRRLFN